MASSRPPKPAPTQHSIMMMTEFVPAPEGLMAVLLIPAHCTTEDAALEWVHGAMELWQNDGPYPTPEHEAFAAAVEEMWRTTARASIKVRPGNIIPPHVTELLRNDSQNDLTRRPN